MNYEVCNLVPKQNAKCQSPLHIPMHATVCINPLYFNLSLYFRADILIDIYTNILNFAVQC